MDDFVFDWLWFYFHLQDPRLGSWILESIFFRPNSFGYYLDLALSCASFLWYEQRSSTSFWSLKTLGVLNCCVWQVATTEPFQASRDKVSMEKDLLEQRWGQEESWPPNTVYHPWNCGNQASWKIACFAELLGCHFWGDNLRSRSTCWSTCLWFGDQVSCIRESTHIWYSGLRGADSLWDTVVGVAMRDLMANSQTGGSWRA